MVAKYSNTVESKITFKSGRSHNNIVIIQQMILERIFYLSEAYLVDRRLPPNIMHRLKDDSPKMCNDILMYSCILL